MPFPGRRECFFSPLFFFKQDAVVFPGPPETDVWSRRKLNPPLSPFSLRAVPRAKTAGLKFQISPLAGSDLRYFAGDRQAGRGTLLLLESRSRRAAQVAGQVSVCCDLKRLDSFHLVQKKKKEVKSLYSRAGGYITYLQLWRLLGKLLPQEFKVPQRVWPRR